MRRCFAIALPLFVAGSLVAGCEAPGPKRVDAQNPRVSYSYQPAEEELAKQDAARYCYENYGRAARLVADVPSGTKRVMTIECVPQ